MRPEPMGGSLAEGVVLAGRYRVLGKLGSGAIGDVYLAEHIQIGRRDAIKVLRQGLAVDPEANARFLRGARNLSAVRHPNVCAIYDFTETEDGLRFLAMEYVEGPSLKEVLAGEGRLPLARAVAIAGQTADALQAAHEAGIVHRDLKPSNIMVARGRGGEEIVKVVDFDIAKGSEGGDEVTRLGFVVGTPEYMSPEQLMGEALDGRSDLYSLGLVLFRMLTGTLPFRGDGPQDLMVARLTSAPAKLNDVLPGSSFPAGLQHALDRVLEPRPADRHADAAAFAHEIRGGTKNAPVGAVPPTRTGPALRGGPSGRAKLYAGIGVAATIVLTAVVVPRVLGDGSGSDPESLVQPTDPQDVTGPPETGRADGDDDPTTRGEVATETTPPSAEDTTPLEEPGVPAERDVPPRTDRGSAPGAEGTEAPQTQPPSVIGFESDQALRTTLASLAERITEPGARPGRAELVAMQDTLLAVHSGSYAIEQRRSAAHLLAHVARYLGDRTQCREWAAESGRLGARVAMLEALCGEPLDAIRDESAAAFHGPPTFNVLVQVARHHGGPIRCWARAAESAGPAGAGTNLEARCVGSQ